MKKIEEYIAENWSDCIKENQNDEGTLIGLPYPYTVPAVGNILLGYVFYECWSFNIGI